MGQGRSDKVQAGPSLPRGHTHVQNRPPHPPDTCTLRRPPSGSPPRIPTGRSWGTSMQWWTDFIKKLVFLLISAHLFCLLPPTSDQGEKELRALTLKPSPSKGSATLPLPSSRGGVLRASGRAGPGRAIRAQGCPHGQ